MQHNSNNNMENFDLIKFIETQWNKLSPEMRNAISESGWLDRLTTVGKKNELSDEQISKLKREIIILFLGGTHPADLYQNIKDNVGVDDIKTVALLEDISDRVFLKIFAQAEALGALEVKEKEWTDKEKEEQEEGLNLLIKEEEQKLSDIEKALIKKYEVAPKPVQDFLINKTLVQKIADIGKKFKLYDDDMSIIEDEIVLALLFGENIEEKLRRRINIPDDLKEEVLKLVRENILTPVNEKMKEELQKFKDKLGTEGLMKELDGLNIKES